MPGDDGKWFKLVGDVPRETIVTLEKPTGVTIYGDNTMLRFGEMPERIGRQTEMMSAFGVAERILRSPIFASNPDTNSLGGNIAKLTTALSGAANSNYLTIGQQFTLEGVGQVIKKGLGNKESSQSRG